MTATPPRRAWVDLTPSCPMCGATDHESTPTIIGNILACPHVPTHRAVMIAPHDLRRFTVAHIDRDPGDEDDNPCG